MSKEKISITQSLLDAGYTEDEIIDNALKVVAVSLPNRYELNKNGTVTVHLQAHTDDIIGYDITVKPIKG